MSFLSAIFSGRRNGTGNGSKKTRSNMPGSGMQSSQAGSSRILSTRANGLGMESTHAGSSRLMSTQASGFGMQPTRAGSGSVMNTRASGSGMQPTYAGSGSGMSTQASGPVGSIFRSKRTSSRILSRLRAGPRPEEDPIRPLGSTSNLPPGVTIIPTRGGFLGGRTGTAQGGGSGRAHSRRNPDRTNGAAFAEPYGGRDGPFSDHELRIPDHWLNNPANGGGGGMWAGGPWDIRAAGGNGARGWGGGGPWDAGGFAPGFLPPFELMGGNGGRGRGGGGPRPPSLVLTDSDSEDEGTRGGRPSGRTTGRTTGRSSGNRPGGSRWRSTRRSASGTGTGARSSHLRSATTGRGFGTATGGASGAGADSTYEASRWVDSDGGTQALINSERNARRRRWPFGG